MDKQTDEMKALRALIRELMEDSRKKKEEIERQRCELSQTQEEKIEVDLKYHRRMSRLRNSLGSAEDKIDDLEADNAALQADNAALQARIAELEGVIIALQ